MFDTEGSGQINRLEFKRGLEKLDFEVRKLSSTAGCVWGAYLHSAAAGIVAADVVDSVVVVAAAISFVDVAVTAAWGIQVPRDQIQQLQRLYFGGDGERIGVVYAKYQKRARRN